MRDKRARWLRVSSLFAAARCLEPTRSPDPEPVFARSGNSDSEGRGSVKQTSAATRVERLPLAAIDRGRLRLRSGYNEQEHAELVSSIAAIGVRNPIHVRPTGNGRFQVIDGGRRVRALQDLQQAEVPALVIEREDHAALLDAILLNSARAELSDYERAKAYRQLLDQGIVRSQQELAKLFGCSQPTVSNLLSMLDLPASARQFLERHPRAISSKCARHVGTLYREFPEHEATLLEGLDQLRQGMKPQGLKAWMAKRIQETQMAAPAAPTATARTTGLKRVVIRNGANGDPAFVVETSVEQRVIRVQVEDSGFSMTMAAKAILQALRSAALEGAADGPPTGDAEEPIQDPVNEGRW
ncbi:ParB/RepB/Spo0J family partition protein [Noviherbaspirillum aridicola]|uniref:ParB-like N-terminal domain-containing protein n=1 Tax=Noviherbaspirillum aridicola TaxID=2849687 RepID=A0ABQ4Q685_9BURK|nr:ParB/RepB/Spo0J family partition protein [Noviherbaspirillum aridicola]GIZ52492.1 hypothetical protein NCCP691_25060 [Noviherbaspirillum aridicola]